MDILLIILSIFCIYNISFGIPNLIKKMNLHFIEINERLNRIERKINSIKDDLSKITDD